MIFVDMMGGLGNQLFQYAAAKSLAISKNSNLFMNLEDYNRQDAKNVEHVDFKLNHFNVDCNNIIVEEDIKKFDNVQKIIEPLSSDNFAEFIDFNKYSGNLHLKGYWQDERYFKNHEHIIKKNLRVITPPNNKNEKILDEISEVNSVCISFRRGEYFDPYFVAQFGMCTQKYYENAINFISKKVDNPVFFVFSDDMDWIEDNVKLDFPTVPVNINGVGKEHEELRLMYSCNHFILANSSFSWWGAWLSDYFNKIVFSPTPWFNSLTKQSILCPNWIHLKCDRSDLFDKGGSKIFELVGDEDFNKLDCYNVEKNIGEYGIELGFSSEVAKIKFDFENASEKYVSEEVLIEFKLFSERRGLIKVDYGEKRLIVLGYRKGFSKRYLHLRGIDFRKLCLLVNDGSLIIQDITIKPVNSHYDLVRNK